MGVALPIMGTERSCSQRCALYSMRHRSTSVLHSTWDHPMAAGAQEGGAQGSSARLGSMQAQPRPPPTHSHPRRALAASSKASMGKGGQGRPYCEHASTPAPPRAHPHACMHRYVLSCGRTVATRGTCMHTHELHKREGPQTPAPPRLPLAPYGAP